MVLFFRACMTLFALATAVTRLLACMCIYRNYQPYMNSSALDVNKYQGFHFAQQGYVLSNYEGAQN